MKFCTECQNMYYISIDEANINNLTYYCRFCGNKDDQVAKEGVVVLKTQYKQSEQKFNHMVNKYTKYEIASIIANNLKIDTSNIITNNNKINHQFL